MFYSFIKSKKNKIAMITFVKVTIKSDNVSFTSVIKTNQFVIQNLINNMQFEYIRIALLWNNYEQ